MSIKSTNGLTVGGENTGIEFGAFGAEVRRIVPMPIARREVSFRMGGGDVAKAVADAEVLIVNGKRFVAAPESEAA